MDGRSQSGAQGESRGVNRAVTGPMHKLDDQYRLQHQARLLDQDSLDEKGRLDEESRREELVMLNARDE